MPSFRTKGAPDVIRDGCYVAKVVFADERTSENGNEIFVMKLQLPGGEVLPCCLTFVDAYVNEPWAIELKNRIRPALEHSLGNKHRGD